MKNQGWKSWIGVAGVVALVLAAIVVYVARFDKVDHTSIYLAQAAVVLSLVLVLLGRVRRNK
ncbi:hypothetical protein [Nocardia tengchongensis]|uniref:hypothetical protein n=1 Tax=Nocardia tengchongensis TaxID=2055889 RepID=UPI0036A3FFB2